jgi:2',3'-cyclic-nucleotide 2'-phosphodiesterase / 3'-nucleotidase / 5'-nucleotidase
MRRALRGAAASLLFLGIFAPIARPGGRHPSGIELRPAGSYASGVFAEGGAEIVAFDPGSRRSFVTNAQAARVDVLDMSDPGNLVHVGALDVTPYGAVANSVAVRGGVVAVAVESAVKTDPGRLVFFDTAGQFLSAVTVGALPDMVAFTPDGRYALVANEGEPDDTYSIDPEGSVSVVDLANGAASLTQAQVRRAGFEAFNDRPLPPSVRVFGPGATAAQDFEPEYIAVSADSRTAYVTLQENNALAVVDVREARVERILGLGFKNHNHPGKELDPSDKDGVIHISRWPVRGMYLPDSIAAYRAHGETYLVVANEGDSRAYSGFNEEARVGSLTLDPIAFPNAAALQAPSALGRLKVTTTLGDIDGDGDYDRLFSFGARSFSIRTTDGRLVFDSGSQLEAITAAALPADFNSTDDANGSFDTRSDDKGPEPEGIAVGQVGDRTYAFVGLERVGGIVAYDVTDPWRAFFAQYVNTRDFGGEPEAGTAGDLSPEGLAFVSAEDSPTGRPLLLAAHEISGTTRVFEILSR